MGTRTCPQADHDTHVLRVLLHNDGSQDLPAKQGGLKTVGEGIEAPVAQHRYLVMEGAASEWKLWGQVAVSGHAAMPTIFHSGQEVTVSWTVRHLSPLTSSVPAICCIEASAKA